MKNIKTILLGAVMMLGLVALHPVAPTYAATPISAACNEPSAKESIVCKQQVGSEGKVNNLLKNVVSILMFVLGGISVIMIVIGGLRYTTSGGDASQIKSAKDTILYSVVGLVVAIFAYAIVNFVLSNI